MAGRMWLWCDGQEDDAAALSTRLGIPLCQTGEVGPSGQDAVFVWGSSRLPERWSALLSGRGPGAGEAAGLPWLLNANAARVAAMGPERLQRELEAAGLHAGGAAETGRLYRVAVGEGEPLLAHRIRSESWRKGMLAGSLASAIEEGGAGLPPSAPTDSGGLPGSMPGFHAGANAGPAGLWRYAEDPAMRRSVRAALRAAYELGLDAAEVLVRAADGGRASIAGIRLPGCRRFLLAGEGKLAEAAAVPEAAAGLWSFLCGRIQGLLDASAQQDGPGIRIGADPEFVILRPDGKIHSASHLGGLSSPVGSDVLLTGRQIRQPVGELRPEPSATAQGLAENIRLLLLRASRRGASKPGMRLLAGAMPLPGLPLGGHVHLSGLPLTSRLLRVLDSYAAFPMALAEDPRGRARRPRYGTLGDSRPQPHGGFEYRTLPSWLVSPAAARYALAVSMLAAEENSRLNYLPSMDGRYVKAYYEGDKETLRECLPALRTALEKVPAYSRHQAWLEPFLDAVGSGASWDESRDLRIRWGIPVPEPISPT
ncbi:putative amidoligase domain-containing protein [Paenibacillus humicus]|uniref:putative amidoligase domain-containing protein n=1 Tax=Paenibacillus humicus TaxID=412861 RepID=UPI003F185202